MLAFYSSYTQMSTKHVLILFMRPNQRAWNTVSVTVTSLGQPRRLSTCLRQTTCIGKWCRKVQRCKKRKNAGLVNLSLEMDRIGPSFCRNGQDCFSAKVDRIVWSSCGIGQDWSVLGQPFCWSGWISQSFCRSGQRLINFLLRWGGSVFFGGQAGRR